MRSSPNYENTYKSVVESVLILNTLMVVSKLPCPIGFLHRAGFPDVCKVQDFCEMLESCECDRHPTMKTHTKAW